MQSTHSDHAVNRMYDVVDSTDDPKLVYFAMAEAINSLKVELDSLWHLVTEASRRAQMQQHGLIPQMGGALGQERKHDSGMVDQNKRGPYL